MIDFTGLEVRCRYCDEPFDGDELDPNGGGIGAVTVMDTIFLVRMPIGTDSL
ncbi:hypothetical protein RB298_04655 [Priestia sp. BR_2]